MTPFLVALGVLYPFLVYFCLDQLPEGTLVGVCMVLLAVRLTVLRDSPIIGLLLPGLLAAGVVLVTLGVFAPQRAAMSYPVVMSLAFAFGFVRSLWAPASLVELFARPFEPAPGAQAKMYMRKASMAWSLFLVCNAALSAASALWAPLWVWTLYNGVLSYALMGVMFLGEWLIRRQVRKRGEGA